jgi:hypothetical protein
MPQAEGAYSRAALLPVNAKDSPLQAALGIGHPRNLPRHATVSQRARRERHAAGALQCHNRPRPQREPCHDCTAPTAAAPAACICTRRGAKAAGGRPVLRSRTAACARHDESALSHPVGVGRHRLTGGSEL